MALRDGISVSGMPTRRTHTTPSAQLLTSLHTARSPTSASSERTVSKASGSEPWNRDDISHSPYQYHPGGDTSVKKDAPSALNVVVIPNVTLPKVCTQLLANYSELVVLTVQELHDTYNKWGKDGY